MSRDKPPTRADVEAAYVHPAPLLFEEMPLEKVARAKYGVPTSAESLIALAKANGFIVRAWYANGYTLPKWRVTIKEQTVVDPADYRGDRVSTVRVIAHKRNEIVVDAVWTEGSSTYARTRRRGGAWETVGITAARKLIGGN